MMLPQYIPLTGRKPFRYGISHMSLPGYNKATYHFAEQMVWQMFRPGD